MDLPLGTTLTVFTAVLAGYATAGEKKPWPALSTRHRRREVRLLTRVINAPPPAKMPLFEARSRRIGAGLSYPSTAWGRYSKSASGGGNGWRNSAK
ncbi:hypothetical protein SODG_002316 [Sodalis praecaptivus]